MSILFISGSPNKNGTTVKLAETMLSGKAFTTLYLVDYKIYSYGQDYSDDQFMEIIEAMKKADVIVIGSPFYWHNMCGAVRNLLDRSYGELSRGVFDGKKLCFVFQGASSKQEQLEAGSYTMSRYASMYGMEYLGMVTSKEQAQQLSVKL